MARGRSIILARRVLPYLVLLVLVLVVALMLAQNRLIFIPRRYPLPTPLPPGLVALPYRTADGGQSAYLRPAQGALHRTWVLFGGNAGLALEWSWLCDSWPRADDALLLIEYPGYGANAGSPSTDAAMRGAAAAYQALATHLGLTTRQLDGRVGVVGHSLGAAMALQFSADHPVDRVVLISPFTELRAMARRTVGWPLCWLLRGNLDNRARLAELGSRQPRPEIIIVHGTADQIVPFAMGQELAGVVPGTDFRPVQGGDHVSVLDDLSAVMREATR